ncbi:MAG TPA: phosphotransferase [Chloroflexaceae bacterium]|nr:phosphotransferase [Chloroflexaceae bacterium]
MSQQTTDAGRPRDLRVLIVDDEGDVRDELAELVRRWGHRPFVAMGDGATLIAHAVDLARAGRCQVAIVDMRLLDPHSIGYDRSGLELVPQLRPAVSVIYSAYGDRKSATLALKEYGAFTFIGKEDSSRDLRAAIEDAARSVCAGGTGPRIEWGPVAPDLAPAPRHHVLGQLFPDRADIPADEAEQLIGMLFAHKSQVALLAMADEEASASPSTDTTLRRSSRLFEAVVEREGRHRVVKLAHADKIANEVERYLTYVENKMPGAYYTELQSHARLWDLGGVVYNYIGADDDLMIFRAFYHAQDDVQRLLRPLNALFDSRNWGFWFRNEPRPIQRSLFAAYDELWKHTLSRHFAAWRREGPALELPGFPPALPNPLPWIARHHAASTLRRAQEAVTHGDLHSDNIIVNESHAFPIDFERTGYGPILRDFVELTQDVSTRVAWARSRGDGRADLALVYNLAVAWCAPDRPDQPLPLTRAIADDPVALKLHAVAQGLRALAHARTHYEDQRELLWGLLLNHLFVASRLHRGSPRWLRTALFAATICGRLERWGEGAWPPPGWPPVAWQ